MMDTCTCECGYVFKYDMDDVKPYLDYELRKNIVTVNTITVVQTNIWKWMEELRIQCCPKCDFIYSYYKSEKNHG